MYIGLIRMECKISLFIVKVEKNENQPLQKQGFPNMTVLKFRLAQI